MPWKAKSPRFTASYFGVDITYGKGSTTLSVSAVDTATWLQVDMPMVTPAEITTNVPAAAMVELMFTINLKIWKPCATIPLLTRFGLTTGRNLLDHMNALLAAETRLTNSTLYLLTAILTVIPVQAIS